MDFSVIIPAYNCEKTIKQTVDSFEAVKYDSMEIILVDDGSTDSSCEVCKQIVDKYSNVRYYYQENAGVSAARNFGIQQANGKYILFCDSDDTVNPKLLRKCMLKAIEQDADMLIFGMLFRYYYHDRFTKEKELKCDNEVLLETKDFANQLAFLFDINYLSSACNKILKRSLCLKVSFNTSKKIFEDLLYVLEYLNYCSTVILMPDLVYIYQVKLPKNNSSKTKCIENFDIYMKEFHNAVLNLEDYTGTELLELRKRIICVYEIILQDKLFNSSYRELKKLEMGKLSVSFFEKSYVPSKKALQLYFSHRFIALKTYFFSHAVIGKIKKNIKSK